GPRQRGKDAMKLYYSAGSCSTSCHITLEEAGLRYEAIEVDWDKPGDLTKLVAELNPLGTLPVFHTDDGKQLDQNIAIHVYAADRAPAKNLLPPAGTLERAQALNWLSFVAADLHKAIGGMFSIPSISEDKGVQAAVRTWMAGRANDHLQYVEQKLGGNDYLMGKQFTPADAYAFVVINWTKYLDIPLAPYKNIQAYLGRIAARPAVQRVLKAEGLLEE
ncbi:MAG TPA: glutathione S-transferase family protein, partial [Planctomycetota bacterium]|nr:glutathione S-transferase family protein [Planctomycetota bacterium]